MDRERKCHEQIYHDFLTLSGVAFTTLWPETGTVAGLLCGPGAFTDDTYIHRTLDFAGYTYRLLEQASEEAMKTAIVESINSGVPVLAYRLVNDDWCLVSGYEGSDEVLLGHYVAEDGDEPSSQPDWAENGAFAKSTWRHDRLRLLLVGEKRPPRTDYAEAFR
jgi:hypothetical protein